MTRAIRLTLAALLVLAVAAPALAAEASWGLAVEVRDTGDYPRVTLAVTLPAEMLQDGSAQPTFSVTENGAEVEVTSVDPESTGALPQDVILLIDTSGSMAGAPIRDAKAAAHSLVDGLDAEDRVALVSFAMKPQTVAGFTSDRAALTAAIDGLEAGGETALHDALVSAARLVESSGRQVTYVLLSDGGDTVSINTFDNAVDAVRASGAPVFAVALESGEWDPQALQLLASASGGRYLGVEDSGELTMLYQGIARELRNRYIVTFVSETPNTKDLDIAVAAALDDSEVTGAVVLENPLYGEVDPDAPSPLIPSRVPAWRSTVTIGVMFLAVTGFVWALGATFIRSGVRLERLDFYDQTREAETVDGKTEGTPGSLRRGMLDAVGYVAGRGGFTKLLHGKLEQAGLPLRPVEYMYLHILFVLASGLLLGILTGSILIAVITVPVTVFVPILLLENAIERRRSRFEEQLPELLNLVAGSLRAGWGMQQAVGLVVEQMAPPASVEFRRVQTEARLGLSVEEALEGMASRLGSEDFKWTVAAINIQREVGGNLAEVLDIVAATMRDRAELKRHIKALTAEGRLSGSILILLPIVELCLLLLVNPRYMSGMLTHPFGWFLALGGLALLIVGGFWLRREMMVEV